MLLHRSNKDYSYNLACIESIAGNNDLAIQYLAKSAEENKLDRNWAWEDPDLEWIRDDPRFIKIVGSKSEQ